MHDSNETIYSYNVTSLRRDSSYITIYVNWFLLITTGLLPMGALVFLNGYELFDATLVGYNKVYFIGRRIYAKILETRKLRERCRIKASNNIPLVLKKSNQPDNQIEDNVENGGEDGIAPVEPEAETAANPNNGGSSSTSAPTAASKRHEAMSTKDFKMARVLLSIVLVFFVCHLPR